MAQREYYYVAQVNKNGESKTRRIKTYEEANQLFDQLSKSQYVAYAQVGGDKAGLINCYCSGAEYTGVNP